MARLIDADVLLEVLKTEPKYSIEAPRGFGDIGKLITNHHRLVVEIIKNQPTAYDVDKVVEQLKEAGFSDESAPNRVVAIVKGGGLECQ